MIDVARSYRGGPTLRYSLDLPTAGTTVLFGPSGGGKTTLLRLLAGLDAPDSGTIAFGDRAWFDSGRNVNVPPQGRRIGYVTQEPALFPHLDVAANVGFGVAPADRPRRIGEALSLVGVSDLAGRMPGTLSGGQKQRVALARALAPAPVLLLLDEPLSALDGLAREGLRRDLGRTLRETGTPAVLVTHDHGEALALGDHVAIVAEGRILQTGPIAQVFSRPASLEAARIVGIETVLEARIVGEPLEGLVTLEASGVRLTAVSPGGDARDVFACIRADEVILEPSAGSTSARNRLPGIVREVREEGSLVRIDVDCGVPLAVRVTRPAARELGLAPGAPITAVIKAPAVHLIPRASR